jgi:hypothetical protein
MAKCSLNWSVSRCEESEPIEHRESTDRDGEPEPGQIDAIRFDLQVSAEKAEGEGRHHQRQPRALDIPAHRSTWVHMYSVFVRVLPIPILLYAAGSEMVSVEIFLVLQAGYTKPASILSLISIFMILIPFIAFTFPD